jgi:hypothetical protein
LLNCGRFVVQHNHARIIQSRKISFAERKSWLEVGKYQNDPRLARYRKMLRAYVLFLSNTSVRVGELEIFGGRILLTQKQRWRRNL